MTIVYDPKCEFCVRCRWWLARQHSYVELEFIPRVVPELARRFPELELSEDRVAELIVISDDGLVYREESAWIMCLWALTDYREWALRLATPALIPFASAFFKQISKRRHVISRLLRGGLEHELERAIHPRHRRDRSIHGPDRCETCHE